MLCAVPSARDAADTLAYLANEAGGGDNITVLVVRCSGEGLDWPTDQDVQNLRYQKFPLPPARTPPPVERGRGANEVLDVLSTGVDPAWLLVTLVVGAAAAVALLHYLASR